VDDTTTTAESRLSLRAVLFADAVEYSRLVLENEPSALELMRQCFRLFRGLAVEHGGALVKTTGDGAVLEFQSAVAAVTCAIAAQRELRRLNEAYPARQRAPFRIGIHLGEVLHEGGDIYGHIVNVAARLQGLAEPGGICLSDAVHEQARHKLDLAYHSMGRQRLKNMAEPVTVYQVAEPGSEAIAPARPAARVSLSVLGGFAVADEEGRPLDIRSRRVCALLGYLALSNRHLEFRDRIAGLLWSGQPIDEAREALTTCIRGARKALQPFGADLVVADRQIVRLDAEGASVDLIDVSRQLAAGTVGDALVEGLAAPERILAGLEDVDAAFASWLEVTRHNWRTRLIRLLEAHLGGGGPISERQHRAALALRAIDATHEEACRCLMRSHASAGNAPAALRLYRELKDLLAAEFEIEPSAETRRLFEEIRAGGREAGGPRSAATPAPARPARLPRIVVGTFRRGEGATGADHLLEGFRQALMTSLVRFRDWIITEDRPPAAVTEDDARAPGAEPVDYRLDAVCAKEHSAFHVSVTFVDAHSGRHVWSDRYRLTLRSWGKAQRDIVRRIAAGMGIYLSTERLMVGGSDILLAAYDKWLKGEHLLARWTPAAEREAEALFGEVIAEMPQFAPAYCSLAGIYNVAHLINPGRPRDRTLEARAMELAQRAVGIDPLDARAHLTLAWSYAMAARFDLAELHYDLAMQLNPNDPKTLVSCAQGLAFAGRSDLSQAAARDALALAPFLSSYQWAYLASARFIAGDYEGCNEASELAGSVIVDVPAWKAAALALSGHEDEAKEAGRRLVEGIRAAWGGDPEAGEEELMAWMLDGYPIRQDSVRERLRGGLRQAGIAVA
jgi:class 3 adenylate cyclase/DNA-binding SARP family transcriptional activator